jgi:hypothetical protein
MERWCARCEWVGSTEGTACPRCRAALLEVQAPGAPAGTGTDRPAETEAGPESLPSPAPRVVAGHLPLLRPHVRTKPDEEPADGTPAGLPEAGADGDAAAVPSDVRPSRRARVETMAWVALPVAVAVAVLGGVLVQGGGSIRSAAGRSGPDATAGAGTISLPLDSRLAYLVEDSHGEGTVGQLFLSDHGGAVASRAIPGTFRPAFAWSPDGLHSAAVDASGALHLLPEDRRLFGPVWSFQFSPDGRFVAVCRGAVWPPGVMVFDTTDPGVLLFPPVAGCDPNWSPDGQSIAFRLPLSSPGAFAADRIGLLDVRRDVPVAVPARWPVAWAPATSERPARLTALSAKGDGIELVDPRHLTRQTLLGAEAVSALTKNVLVGRVSALSWAPDGDRLAIAFSADPYDLQGLVVMRTSTGERLFVGAGYTGLATLSWSVKGDLLATSTGAGGRLTQVIRNGEGFAEIYRLGQTSWSSDGRWLLGRDGDGWVVVDASPDGERTPRPVSSSSRAWILAQWCCPAVPVTAVLR